jgi:hypothetical protein
MVEEIGHPSATKSPLMTPFHLGLSSSAIPHVDISPEDVILTSILCPIELYFSKIHFAEAV